MAVPMTQGILRDEARNEARRRDEYFGVFS